MNKRILAFVVLIITLISVNLFWGIPYWWSHTGWLGKGLPIAVFLTIMFAAWGRAVDGMRYFLTSLAQVINTRPWTQVVGGVVITLALIVLGELWLFMPRLIEDQSDQAIPRGISRVVITLLLPFMVGILWKLYSLPGKASHAGGLSFILSLAMLALIWTYNQNRKVLAPAIYQQAAGTNETCVGWHEHSDGICWSYLIGTIQEKAETSDDGFVAEQNLVPTHDQPAAENRYFGQVGKTTGVLCASHNQEFLFIEPNIQRDLEVKLAASHERVVRKVDDVAERLAFSSWPKAKNDNGKSRSEVTTKVVIASVNEWSEWINIPPHHMIKWYSDQNIKIKTLDGTIHHDGPHKTVNLNPNQDPMKASLRFQSDIGQPVKVVIETWPK